MHPWRARAVVTVVMIILAFVGLILTDTTKTVAWQYWRGMIVVFAGLCLWLSWYLRRGKHMISALTIWHEVLHWVGLFTAAFLVSVFVGMGIMGRFEAALMMLTLLALTTFLAGIYYETSFIVIGLVLGFFTAGAAFLEEYLYSILLPATLIVVVIVLWVMHKKHQLSKK